MTWLLIDEDENTLNDTMFCINPVSDPNHWQDIPAARHAGGAGLSFVDGHSELRTWHDKYLLMQPPPQNGSPTDPNAKDWYWLASRTTAKK